MVIYFKPSTRRRALIVSSLVLVVLGVRLGVGLTRGAKEVAGKVNPITTFSTSEPLAGLVIDVAAPGPEPVKACLEVLEALAVKATWFVTATFAESQEASIRELAAAGHELGLKGTDEKRMDRLSSPDVKDRLARSAQALEKADLEPAPFLLPPAGRTSAVLLQTAFNEGYHCIKPGVDARKMKGKPQDAGKKLAGAIKPGDIVLLQVDNKGLKPAEDHLRALAAAVAEHGISLVSLSELVRSVR